MGITFSNGGGMSFGSFHKMRCGIAKEFGLPLVECSYAEGRAGGLKWENEEFLKNKAVRTLLEGSPIPYNQILKLSKSLKKIFPKLSEQNQVNVSVLIEALEEVHKEKKDLEFLV